MRALLLIASAALAVASAFTIHQHSSQQQCVDLQCPAASFDYGKKSLVNEETLSSEPCSSCQQCTSNGYSVCMRTRSTSRARRQSDSCSCAHSIPANCHNQLAQTTHPANITMQLYNICYTSSVQAPPRPLAKNENESVIVTVEPFWQEPYWRDLDLDKLTLHYEYIVKVPEHCDGEVVTSEGVTPVHTCVNHLKIEMTTDKSGEDDYEHSENYDEYDDQLPPEVQFDRDVFAGAKETKVFYKVQVRRPRQLKMRTTSTDPFEDLVTDVESEVLRFDLKPEIYGTGIPGLPSAPINSPETKEVDNRVDDVIQDDDKEDGKENAIDEEEEEDDEEDGPEGKPGTDFFNDDTKDTEEEKAEEKEEEKLAEKAAEEEKESREHEDKTEAPAVKEDEEKEDADGDAIVKAVDEKDEDKKEDDEESEDDKKEEKEDEEDDKEEEEDEEKDRDKKEDDEDEDDKDDEEKEGEQKEGESGTDVDATTPDGDSAETDETTDNEKDEETETDEDNEEGSGDDEDEEDGSWFEWFKGSFFKDKYHMGRWVFAITLVVCCLFITGVCLYRRCCAGKKHAKTANGHRYEAPAAQSHQLVSPERMHLNQ